MDGPLVHASQPMRPGAGLAAAGTHKTATAAAAASAEASSGFGFTDVLSALNPLQYLPVVGSIYRAVTGDVVPEAVRTLGSLAVGGIMGGPIGLAVSAATTLFEKVAGIDPDRLVHQALAAVGIVSDPSPPAVAGADAAVQPAAATSAAVPFTRAQRIAYRTVITDPVVAGRSLSAAAPAVATTSGADIAHRQAAAAAYARNWLAYAEHAPHRAAARSA